MPGVRSSIQKKSRRPKPRVEKSPHFRGFGFGKQGAVVEKRDTPLFLGRPQCVLLQYMMSAIQPNSTKIAVETCSSIKDLMEEPRVVEGFRILGDSCAVISGAISRITIAITHIGGLITLLITTHEPPSSRIRITRTSCQCRTEFSLCVMMWNFLDYMTLVCTRNDSIPWGKSVNDKKGAWEMMTV